MITKIMTDRYSLTKTLSEIKEEWLLDLLLNLGIDINRRIEESPAHFLEYLFSEKIEVVDYLNLNALQVFHQGELVGEWMESESTLKSEGGRYYYEVEVEHWSIIEENINF